MNEAQREVALFRYSLVREAADESLSVRQRGRLVRELAGRDHAGPNDKRVRVARGTIDRWIRAYRGGGFDALAPVPRTGEPVTEKRLLDLAAALKREVPARTGAQIAQIIRTAEGDGPSERTIQRHLARLGLNTRPDGSPPEAFGRFEAAAPGDLWTGDALHGPVIGGRKTYLFAFIDDHSRALVGYRWGHSEDTVRLEAAFRAALGSRGVPRRTYVDNGSAYVSKQLLRACASLGVRLVHSKPGRPEGRGKIERVFKTVRMQFLVEIEARLPADLAELNRRFAAWVETVYHRNVHSETGEAPIDRLLATGPPALPTPAALHEAFLWSETRKVTKTATISLHGNAFEVDAALVGSSVEVVFDPFDLESVEIRFQGRSMGSGIPVAIGRHSHPQARPEAAPAPAPTGIDYLGLLVAHREAEVTARSRPITYSQLSLPADEIHVSGEGTACSDTPDAPTCDSDSTETDTTKEIQP
jgi:putative transposase